MAKKLQVADFFKTDVPAYGCYDNVRKLCSYIDGQKISMRKIIYTLMEQYKGKDKVKTETVANMCAAFTNYLHGAANLGGVCDTMAQSFVGSNNFPLLEGNTGGFGTRINPVCSANRYTKISLSNIVSALFNNSDKEITACQIFEKEKIEPAFFVPVFPVLFLNGSTGLSIGFGQDIYPRNPNDIIKYIKEKLLGNTPNLKLLPWFKNHLGKVSYNKELDKNESFGVITRNNTTSYTITELPIGMTYQKYNEVLDKLYDAGIIQDYDDRCDTKTDKILYTVKTTRDFTKKHSDERKLYETFKLIKTLPENLCCIDENNMVRKFSSIQEILDKFINIRLSFYQKRKDYLLSTIKADIEKLASKLIFCLGIIKNEIKVANVKKADIVKQLSQNIKIKTVDDSYDYLLNMPIHSITAETVLDLKTKILALKDKFTKTKEMTIKDMWITDLDELKKYFK